ncbi:MAG: adenosylcobinamide amidohydrolase, partial [Spirochaetota bacterium]
MKIKHTHHYIIIRFENPLRALSSASCRGGLVTADTIVNLMVTAGQTLNNTPEGLIRKFLKKKNLPDSSIGLLTSAKLRYSQFILTNAREIDVLAVVS